MSGRGDGRRGGRLGGYEQIPEGFIRELEERRRRLVKAQEENDVNLDALVDFLYPDTAHLVFELLQNAEDARAARARFSLSASGLSFAHDGDPFSEEDLKNITNYFKSSKYEKQDKVGRFGIGFKSVFACTDTPRIYSDTVAFEIVDRIVPRSIVRPASSMISGTRETVIELPFNGPSPDTEHGQATALKSPEEACGEIRRGLEQMSAMSILHLAHIRSIEWITFNGAKATISRTELEDGVLRIDIARVDADGTPTVDRRWFLRFRERYRADSSLHLDVAFELEKTEGEQEASRVARQAIGDRFRIVPARGVVSVFFPAKKETSNLRFHVHAPFIPELSRASIKEHRDNDQLIGRLAALVARALPTIRDLGLLDREFLGVLPNSKDRLPDAYAPFRDECVRAMRNAQLVPMQGGGHGAGMYLVQGLADLKGFLGVKDLRFLLSGPNGGGPVDSQGPLPTSVSTFRGWSVSATLKNTDTDRFLEDIGIRRFMIRNLAPPSSRSDSEIRRWMRGHSIDWHKAYYAALAKHWDSKEWIKQRQSRHGSYVIREDPRARLRRAPIVRTESRQYVPGAKCYFVDDIGADAPDGVVIADRGTYAGGPGGKNARRGLEIIGVSEIDGKTRALGILNKYYAEYSSRPSWGRHRRHLATFIELVRSGSVMPSVFRAYCVLRASHGAWVRPEQLYGRGWDAESGARHYFEALAKQPERQGCRVWWEVATRYGNTTGFHEFARGVGVSYGIPVLQTGCQSNREYDHLVSGGGQVWRSETGIDSDWHVPCLGPVLYQLESGDGRKLEREGLAQAIWTALQKHDRASEAMFRMNRSADTCTAPSQLVAVLRRRSWVPQRHASEGLVFVRPSEAWVERLPDWFSVATSPIWTEALEFGKRRLEAARKAESEQTEREARAESREAMARELGFEDLAAMEEARRFAELSQEERTELWKRHEAAKRRRPRFDLPPNPDLRRRRVREGARNAPIRAPEVVERSVFVEDPRLKEEARTKLRARYEEHAHCSLCQIDGCNEKSFRNSDGAWYFEAVRFLRLNRTSPDDYVAVCPLHAAMFRHAHEREGIRHRFSEACADASRNGYGVAMVETVLAGERVHILMDPKHAIDLDEALKVDGPDE